MTMSNHFPFTLLVLVALGCPTDDRFIITEKYAIDTTWFDSKMLNNEGDSPCDRGFVPIEREPEPIHKVMPDFPKEAIATKKKGKVWVTVFVDTTGRVIWARIVKTDDVIFNKSALKAAIQWKFRPALMSNVPIGVCVSLPFKFYRQGD